MRVNFPQNKNPWIIHSQMVDVRNLNICTAPGFAITTFISECVHQSQKRGCAGVYPSLTPKMLNLHLSQQHGEKKTSASSEITLQLFLPPLLAHLQCGNDLKKYHLWKTK